MFVDNVVMQLIQYFSQFDVILISNMFGDIFSDEVSVLVGFMGLLFLVLVGVYIFMFEFIYGFFLQAVGQDIVNFMVVIFFVVMLVEFFGMNEVVKSICIIVQYVLEKGIGMFEFKLNIVYGCSKIGDFIVYFVVDLEEEILVWEDKANQQMLMII